MLSKQHICPLYNISWDYKLSMLCWVLLILPTSDYRKTIDEWPKYMYNYLNILQYKEKAKSFHEVRQSYYTTGNSSSHCHWSQILRRCNYYCHIYYCFTYPFAHVFFWTRSFPTWGISWRPKGHDIASIICMSCRCSHMWQRCETNISLCF